MRPTIVTISLSALERNARVLRNRVPQGVRMCCVVKADAYGHGALQVARRLHEKKLADAFAVAIVEEAASLREDGLTEPIVILGDASEESLRAAVKLGVSQTVDSVEALRVLEDEAKRLGRPASAHLKLDTGMSRIGVRNERALDALLSAWRSCPDVRMDGCFTHFCVAESDPAFTLKQEERFERFTQIVRKAGFSPVEHAAATSAMLDGRFHHHMVRAGIGLYGGGMPELEGELEYAQRLTTRAVRVVEIEPGDTVGYGRTFRAERSTRVMTIPIGYGDGYPRVLSNRADVLVRGRRARIIGNVCMDMLMVDVTDIPGAAVGDEVVLMGAQGAERITPAELAAHAGTIEYEIMLGFSARVPRAYED